MKKQKYIKGIAYEYGVKAFKRGLKAIPVTDQQFLNDVIAGCQVGEGTPYFKEWIQGWTDENLKMKIL